MHINLESVFVYSELMGGAVAASQAPVHVFPHPDSRSIWPNSSGEAFCVPVRTW
jgi:hypothetical protein